MTWNNDDDSACADLLASPFYKTIERVLERLIEEDKSDILSLQIDDDHAKDKLFSKLSGISRLESISIFIRDAAHRARDKKGSTKQVGD